MKKTESTVDRFRKAINDNRFTMTEELEMLDILVNKYNPRSVSDYAKEVGKSQPYISKILKQGKIMFLQFGSIKLIIDN